MSERREAIELAKELVAKHSRLDSLILKMSFTQWNRYFKEVVELIATEMHCEDEN